MLHQQQILSPTENTALKHHINSPAFNSVTLRPHTTITTSHICIIYAAWLVWHIRITVLGQACVSLPIRRDLQVQELKQN